MIEKEIFQGSHWLWNLPCVPLDG